jgi:hypothetical protein
LVYFQQLNQSSRAGEEYFQACSSRSPTQQSSDWRETEAQPWNYLEATAAFALPRRALRSGQSLPVDEALSKAWKYSSPPDSFC